MIEPPILSIVVPCFDEQGNLIPLVTAIRAAMAPLPVTYEVVVADDASSDGSWQILQTLGAADARIRAVRLDRNCGQSAALWAGVQAAKGRFIATMDADLQNDPRDLPKFLAAIQHCDCVCGSRVAARAQGDSRRKQFSSWVANGIRNWFTRETISDSACGYRIFRNECAAHLKFFKGMHRFIPTLLRIEGFAVTEIPIGHHARFTGQSHYGMWNRLLITVDDLLAVRWMQTRIIRYEVKERINFPPSTSAR
jgi:glycosyltransferase involved in cell wall biosynthesis